MRDATAYRHNAATVPGDTHKGLALASSARMPGDAPLAALAPALFANVPLDLNAPTSGEPLTVAANHGRWVVSCPDCYNGQLAHPSDPRFLCNVCGNVGNGRNFRPVAWPKDHEKIGELLDARDDVSLRNWSPGETVADLKAENTLLDGRPTLLEPAEYAHPKWEGHTHRYPKRLPDPAVVERIECQECGHPTRVIDIHDAREADLDGAHR